MTARDRVRDRVRDRAGDRVRSLRRAAGAAALALLLLTSGHRAAEAVVLEEQVKFDVRDESDFEKVRGVRQLLSYRVRHRGEYLYEDYYYDTPGLSLYESGYSFRFRVRNKGKGVVEYGIQLKKEYEPGGRDFRRREVDDVIPEEMALDILAGNWHEAYSGKHDYKTIKALREILKGKRIDAKSLSPVLYGQQRRSRFTLKEDRKLYFEVSLDKCLFRRIGAGPKRETDFLQLEYENKFKKGRAKMDDRERRIRDLQDYFTRSMSAKTTAESKYRSAVQGLLRK